MITYMKKLDEKNKDEKNYFVLKLCPSKNIEPFTLENEIISYSLKPGESKFIFHVIVLY